MPKGDLPQHVIIYQAPSPSPSGSGLLSPSPQSEQRASAECRESCGRSKLEEEPIEKTCAQEATRDMSPIIFI